jgi:hypothetical protein
MKWTHNYAVKYTVEGTGKSVDNSKIRREQHEEKL